MPCRLLRYQRLLLTTALAHKIAFGNHCCWGLAELLLPCFCILSFHKSCTTQLQVMLTDAGMKRRGSSWSTACAGAQQAARARDEAPVVSGLLLN